MIPAIPSPLGGEGEGEGGLSWFACDISYKMNGGTFHG
jgi:hypothetical protein